MRNILGISLGTRLIGLAVVYDGELYDFRVRTFYGPWTEKKRRAIVETIRRVIQRYEVGVVSLKAPKPAYCTERINDVLSDVQGLATNFGISLRINSITTLKAHCNGLERSNKKELMRMIAEKYAQHQKLAELNAKERENQNAYHMKLFEAIACTELA